MEELSLITADDAYYTCLGSYDPIKSNPVSKNTKRNIEVSISFNMYNNIIC